MKTRIRFLAAAGILCILIGGILFLRSGATQVSNSDETIAGGGGMPGSIVWEPQRNQSSARNGDGNFGIQASFTTSTDMLLFYALQSPRKGIPQAVVDSPFISVAKVQSLGNIGSYDVGVIQFRWSDHPGQVLALRVVPPGGNQQGWQVAPLKQVGSGKYLSHGIEFAPIDSDPAFTVETGRTGEDQSDVKISLSDQSNQTAQPIFVRINRQMDISLITESEFNAAYRPLPITAQPGPTVNPE